MGFLWERRGCAIAILCPEADVSRRTCIGSAHMLDGIYLLLGVGGFAACLGFLHLCDIL
jgi:hypothetical protein